MELRNKKSIQIRNRAIENSFVDLLLEMKGVCRHNCICVNIVTIITYFNEAWMIIPQTYTLYEHIVSPKEIAVILQMRFEMCFMESLHLLNYWVRREHYFR